MLRQGFTQSTSVILALVTMSAWSQTNLELPLPGSEVTTQIVIQPNYAEVHKPEQRPVHLAFSPDNHALAYSSIKQMAPTEYGEFWASQLHLLPLLPIGQATTLIDADSTSNFGFYGAPAVELTWPDDKIHFVISNGDDSATEIRYLVKEQRLENPKIGEYTIDEPYEPTPLQQAIAKCFADWPQNVVKTSNAKWLLEGEKALYQSRQGKNAHDLYLLNIPTCKRQLIALPTQSAEGRPLSNRLLGGVVQDAQLLLALESVPADVGKNAKIRSNTLLLQTNIHTLGSPNAEWLNWSYGLGNNNQFAVISHQPNKVLFLIKKPSQPCKSKLFSLSERQLTSFTVDNHKICNAAVSRDGQLALALSVPNTSTKAKTSEAEPLDADQIWIVNKGFLNNMVN
jgi:hypothetical protein